MLADTNMPVKDIAFRLGFSDPSAFSRAFRRWTGGAPASYRQQHRRLTNCR
jgi:AraC-like DNA-binding protein